MQTMTRGNESSAATGDLLVAFELSQRWWKVGFTTGMGHRVRTRRIAAGALEPLTQAIADAKKMFGLAAPYDFIHVFPPGPETITLPFTGGTLQGLNVEPSTLTDFHGATAVAFHVGEAKGSDGHKYNLETDMRVMEGKYVAVDGTTRHGSFALI